MGLDIRDLASGEREDPKLQNQHWYFLDYEEKIMEHLHNTDADSIAVDELIVIAVWYCG